MDFEIRHRFEAPADAVLAAMFDPELPPYLERHMALVRRVEPLDLQETGTGLRRRTRYTPEPLIRRIGPKAVPAHWMAWVEESTLDRARRRVEFRNVPVVETIAALLENRGAVTLVEASGATERVVAGVLRVRFPILGRIAERVIYPEARRILDEEARVLARFLAERRA